MYIYVYVLYMCRYMYMYIYMYMYMHMRMYIYICTCICTYNCIWIICAWGVNRQYIYYLEAIHILFWANFFTQIYCCVSDDVNNSFRGHCDGRGDRTFSINSLNAELKSNCHLVALFEDHHIFHYSRIKVKTCQYIIPQHVWCENS